MKHAMNIRPLTIDGYKDPHLQGPMSFPYYTFAYLVEGELLVEIEGKNLLLTAGQLLLVPEKQAITIKHLNGCKGFDGRFDIDYLKDASYSVLRSHAPVLQSFWFDDAVFMAALFQRMLSAREDRDHRFQQSALDLILSQLRPGGRVAVVPESFLQMVFEQDKAPLSVSAYASRLGVTANYLNKTVKAHTYRTAIDWIEIARLNMAKKLLSDKSVPIANVASRIGIDDQSYFSRFFKKKTGLTPSQYRRGQ